MRKRLLLITGSPGIGKTSVLLKTVEALKGRGYSVGGMVSREVRSCGARVGFEVLDLSGGGRGWLAHIHQKQGPQVGKYRVNLGDLDSVGSEAIIDAVKNVEVVVIDEIGPMELYSEYFRKAIKNAVESRKLVIGTVHWKVTDKLIREIRGREDAETYIVTYANRGNLHKTIVQKAVEFLKVH